MYVNNCERWSHFEGSLNFEAQPCEILHSLGCRRACLPSVGPLVLRPAGGTTSTLLMQRVGMRRLEMAREGSEVSLPAIAVAEAVLSVLHPVRARVHTFTWGNDSEFAEHRVIDVGLDANSYFAMPYSSWQRGCNENLNGLVRQYIPKGCDIGTFTDEHTQQIEDKLNRRPRKQLDFCTPEQLFELSFKRVALRS